MNDKTVSLIGLCRRSGNLLCGATAAETAIKRKKCFLVFIAVDAGESIKRKIIGLCTTNEIPFKIMSDKKLLGKAAGLDEKAVIAIKSKDFAEGILKNI